MLVPSVVSTNSPVIHDVATEFRIPVLYWPEAFELLMADDPFRRAIPAPYSVAFQMDSADPSIDTV
jgi:hypothetical protein